MACKSRNIEIPTGKQVTSIVYDGVYHTPPGRFSIFICFFATKRVPIPNDTYVFGELSAVCFQRRPFRHRHYSNHSSGDIDHEKSPPGVCDICTPSYTVCVQAYKGLLTQIAPGKRQGLDRVHEIYQGSV